MNTNSDIDPVDTAVDTGSLNDDFVEAESGEEVELLTLSYPPITFEPISSLTNVFFDRDNQQIFCVRSNGVGGVIVKGPRNELNLSFRMEDKGSVATIRFSPSLNILAIRRRDKQAIEFLNFKNGQPVFPEYSQPFKAKNTKFQECFWLDANEILLVSEQGFEHYQIFADKRALKLIKNFSMALNWLIWSREAQVFIVSTGSYGTILNPFVYNKGAFIKLPKFEVDLPMNSIRFGSIAAGSSPSTTSSNRFFLNESDVFVGRIYNEFYVMVIRQVLSERASLASKRASVAASTPSTRTSSLNGYSEIAMYKLLTDNPAKKTNILKIDLASRFTLSIIDELVIVHDRASYSSMIFDIKMPGEFDGYVTCNYPVIKKASIQRFSQQEATGALASTDDQPSADVYSMNWIMFLPNIIIDAKLGLFWYIELNLLNSNTLDLRVFREIKDDYLKLIEFLLNRRNTKRHVIKACQIAIQEKVSLKIIGQIFNKINELYKLYLLLVANLNTNQSSMEVSGASVAVASVSLEASVGVNNPQLKDLAIVDQLDMHNEVLYSLVEDAPEDVDSKYTIAILVEYFRSLNEQRIPVEHVLYKLLVDALIKSNRQQQLHQYLQ